ncbi:hypothetical protein F4808DRAFT_410977 [Astrocystis sublimbata]|nr:hypothetical protein F4808DRAFT_410977 [Astrocystis sublimbata]
MLLSSTILKAPLVCLGLLASLGASDPAIGANDTDTAHPLPPLVTQDPGVKNSTKVWILDDLSRWQSHKNHRCKWEFRVSESDKPPHFDDQSPLVHCKFTVKVPRILDCRSANWYPTKCHEDYPDYYVAGAQDTVGAGKLTITITSAFNNEQASFGYSDWELDSGNMIPTQMSPVKQRY